MRFLRFILWWGRPLAITPPAEPLLLGELKSQLGRALTAGPGEPVEGFSTPKPAMLLDMTLAGMRLALKGQLTEN